MKKILVLFGIVAFFTCTAIDISFTNWTLIEKAFRQEAVVECDRNHAIAVFNGTTEINGMSYYLVMCVCKKGYALDPSTHTCVGPIPSSDNQR